MSPAGVDGLQTGGRRKVPEGPFGALFVLVRGQGGSSQLLQGFDEVPWVRGTRGCHLHGCATCASRSVRRLYGPPRVIFAVAAQVRGL